MSVLTDTEREDFNTWMDFGLDERGLPFGAGVRRHKTKHRKT